MAESDYAKDLARQILVALKKEFETKKLSGNLINTVRVDEYDDYVEIHIPAPTYDFYEYFMHGVVVPPKKGGIPESYAVTLDASGSQFTLYWETAPKNGVGRGNVRKKVMKPRNHVGYVNRTISEGISTWSSMQELEIKVEQ